MGFIPLHGWLVHYAAATRFKCGAHISQQTDCMFPKRQCIFTPYARNKIILEQYYSWKHIIISRRDTVIHARLLVPRGAQSYTNMSSFVCAVLSTC